MTSSDAASEVVVIIKSQKGSIERMLKRLQNFAVKESSYSFGVA